LRRRIIELKERKSETEKKRKGTSIFLLGDQPAQNKVEKIKSEKPTKKLVKRHEKGTRRERVYEWV